MEVLIDLLTYFLHYLPEILLALPCLGWMALEIKTDGSWRRIVSVCGLAATGLALLQLLATIPGATHHAWSAARLAPAAAWVRGFHLYYPPQDGPTLIQMYGPFSAIVYVPATLIGSTPTTEILLGTLINSLCYLAPAIWLIRVSLKRMNVYLLLAMSLFLALTCRQFILLEAATRVTIDAPAVGLGVCAMACAVRSKTSGWRDGFICGTLIAMSIWTKLTYAPIGLAILAYVMLTRDARRAFYFAGSFAIASLVMTCIVLAGFGYAVVAQNLIIPLHQPWQWPTLDRKQAFIRAAKWIWRYSSPAYVILALALLMNLIRRLRSARQRPWVPQNPWILPLIASLLVLPTATLAYVKVGGSWNNGVVGSYCAILAAAVLLGQMCDFTPPTEPADRIVVPIGVRIARTFAVLVLVLASCWMVQSLHAGGGVSGWRTLYENEHEQAYQYARMHPDEAYFPIHPLSSLLAEGKLYHFAAGIDSTEWGGVPISPERFTAGLPIHLRYVFYRADGPTPAILSRFPDFVEAAEDPAMLGWKSLTTRPASTQP